MRREINFFVTKILDCFKKKRSRIFEAGVVSENSLF